LFWSDLLIDLTREMSGERQRGREMEQTHLRECIGCSQSLAALINQSVVIHLTEFFLCAHDVSVVSLPATDIAGPVLHLTNRFLGIPDLALFDVPRCPIGSQVDPNAIIFPRDEILFLGMKEATELSAVIDSERKDEQGIDPIPRVKSFHSFGEISDRHDALLDDMSIDRGLADDRSLEEFEERDFRGAHPSPEEAIERMVREGNHIFQFPEDAPECGERGQEEERCVSHSSG
jgi:hypothetical protein